MPTVRREHGTYSVLDGTGSIVPGAQRECLVCWRLERREAWMQLLDYGTTIGRFWECVFLGSDAAGCSVTGGCGFSFPDDFSQDVIAGLLEERIAFVTGLKAQEGEEELP